MLEASRGAEQNQGQGKEPGGWSDGGLGPKSQHSLLSHQPVLTLQDSKILHQNLALRVGM